MYTNDISATATTVKLDTIIIKIVKLKIRAVSSVGRAEA